MDAYALGVIIYQIIVNDVAKVSHGNMRIAGKLNCLEQSLVLGLLNSDPDDRWTVQ